MIDFLNEAPYSSFTKTFFETADFLDFSLNLHNQRPDFFVDLNPLIASPWKLNSFFPQCSSENTVEMIDLGMLRISGRPPKTGERGLQVVLSVGLHGNETAPIEIVRDIVAQVLLGKTKVAGEVLIFFGHLEAMVMKKRQIEENLNRCFGIEENVLSRVRSQEQGRANRLKLALKNYRNPNLPLLHLDLHTAIRDSLYPRFAVLPQKKSEQDYTHAFLRCLERMGLQAFLMSDGATTTFSHYTSALYSGLSATVELGAVREFGKNNHQDFLQARHELIRLLETNCLPNDSLPVDVLFFDVIRTLKRKGENFKFLFSEDLPNFSKFKAETPIMEDDGRVFRIHSDDERIVFPNSKVGIGERAGLIVSPRKRPH